MRETYTNNISKMISEVWSKDIELAMIRTTTFTHSKPIKLTKWQRFRYWYYSLPHMKAYRHIGKWITRKLMNHFDIVEYDDYC